MASFQTQVMGLTDLNISSSGTNPTEAQLTQFLTDGSKEIINTLPPNLLDWCASQQTFTSVMPGSEAETMNTGKILRVYRNDGDFDRVCRRIRADEKGYANDPDEMGYASVTDPVFYTENNKLNALPEAGSCKYDEVQYPAVAYSDDAIAVFPDEAEYLVVLYGAVKSLQNVLGDKSSNSDISTAIGLIKTAVDQAATAAGSFLDATGSVFGDTDTFLTTNSQLTRVKGALDNAEAVINGDAPSTTTDAYGALSAEDTEIVTSALSIATSEISRAQAHLSEWTSIGDMRVKEINAALSEAKGYADEVQVRLQVDTAHYGWYEKQQAKLQADYEGGIQKLLSGYKG
jgi:hypothetical protein